MEHFTLPTSETQMVVALLVKTYAPCTIFAFGYSNNSTLERCLLPVVTDTVLTRHHFYLLVFTNKALPNASNHIANVIAEQSNKTITASVLLHKVSDLATKPEGQQWFFDSVLRFGQRLLLDASAPPYLLVNVVPPRAVEAERTYWLKCVAVAQFMIHSAAESVEQDVELCKIALLHAAIVEVALGLLRVFLGYTPNEFGLKYHLQLCCHFTDLPEQLFHYQTPEAISRYKMLCAPPSLLHHWTRLHAADSDFVLLLTACQEFLSHADEIVLLELHRLENISLISSPL